MTDRRKQMELIRLQAMPLIRSGLPLAEVGRRVHVARTTVCRWNKLMRAGVSLAAHEVPGRPPVLSDAELRAVYIERSSWTAALFAAAIEEAYGVVWHIDTVYRRLAELRGKPWKPRKGRKS